MKEGDGYSNNVYFKRALDKYGWDNFLHLILYSNLSKEQANQLEITLIQYYKSINLSYNITNGGEGTIGLHTPKTIEHKTNISKALKGKPKSKEVR